MFLRGHSTLRRYCTLIHPHDIRCFPKILLLNVNHKLLQIWLEDACHERYWVDRPECQDFIDTLINSFDTLTPESDLLPPPEHGPGASGSSSPALITDLEPNFQDELAEIIQDHKVEVDETLPRYEYESNAFCTSTTFTEISFSRCFHTSHLTFTRFEQILGVAESSGINGGRVCQRNHPEEVTRTSQKFIPDAWELLWIAGSAFFCHLSD